MSKHTPGPWTIHQPAHYDSKQVEDRLIAAGNGEHVAEVYQYRSPTNNDSDGIALANACLIAAAPDFYQAAKGVLAAFEANVFVRNIDNDHDTTWAIKALPHLRALAQLAAAIDKVEDKQPLRQEQEA